MKYACYGRLSAGFRVMLFASNPIKEHELEGKGKVRNENTDPEQENELVLHFDVNKTIIMIDKAAGKSTSDLLNIVIANAAWGHIHKGEEGEGKAVWKLFSKNPSILSPGEGLITYSSFVEKTHPFSRNIKRKITKKSRDALTTTFTNPGQPGSRLRGFVESLRHKLQLPSAVVGTKLSRQAGLDGAEVYLLPSFLRALRTLKESKRKFSVIFRTFGSDLLDVAREFNAFCCGVHPLHVGFRMDGSDGQPDMRLFIPGAPTSFPTKGSSFRTEEAAKCSVELENSVEFKGQPRFGSIDRSEQTVTLALGTLKQRKSASDGYPFSHVAKERIITGKRNIYNFFKKAVSRGPLSLAIRDCFVHWREHSQAGNAGKLFVLDSINLQEGKQQIFFDDNIQYHNAKIVDICDIRSPDVSVPLPRAIGRFLVRAEPLESITNESYYVNKIKQCEESFRRSFKIRTQLRKSLLKCPKIQQTLRSIHNDQARTPSPQKPYIPWPKLPEICRSSTSTTFEEVSEPSTPQTRVGSPVLRTQRSLPTTAKEKWKMEVKIANKASHFKP